MAQGIGPPAIDQSRQPVTLQIVEQALVVFARLLRGEVEITDDFPPMRLQGHRLIHQHGMELPPVGRVAWMTVKQQPIAAEVGGDEA